MKTNYQIILKLLLHDIATIDFHISRNIVNYIHSYNLVFEEQRYNIKEYMVIPSVFTLKKKTI